MSLNPLVKKIKASGYMPTQKPKPSKPVTFSKKHSLSSADTKKGSSRAYVSRDAMPVSIEPIKSPRSKTLSQISRSIGRV